MSEPADMGIITAGRGIRSAQLKVVVETASKALGREFEKGGSVNHSIGEYVRGDVHTNTIDGYFSVFKRGIMGTYHHLSQQHLKRYLAEFGFRYNERSALGVEDAERARHAVGGVIGKRMTYQQADRNPA